MNGQSIVSTSYQVLSEASVLLDSGHSSCTPSRFAGSDAGNLSTSSLPQGGEYATQVQIPYEGHRKEYDWDDYHQCYDELPFHFIFSFSISTLSFLALIRYT